MLAHLDLFHQMLNLRGLLQLAAHMEERGDRVTLISAENITLVGNEMSSQSVVQTAKGAQIESGVAYSVLRGLKGHDAPEYAVTREELAALNARAVELLEASPELAAFAETLTRISGETPSERPSRRRSAEAEVVTPAADVAMATN